jgi:hypothetical protein
LTESGEIFSQLPYFMFTVAGAPEASQESSGNFPGSRLQGNITSPSQEKITLAVTGTLFHPQETNPFLNGTRKIPCRIGSLQYQKRFGNENPGILHIFLQCIAVSG